MRGLSLVAASGGHSSSRCAGLSLSRPLLLRSTGSRRADSVIVAHGPSCSAACGIFPDQGSSPCPLHWQADSQPLHHQGSPTLKSFYTHCNGEASSSPCNKILASIRTLPIFYIFAQSVFFKYCLYHAVPLFSNLQWYHLYHHSKTKFLSLAFKLPILRTNQSLLGLQHSSSRQ